MWSERRSNIMLSSIPGLVHYYLLLEDVVAGETDCNRTLSQINQTAFLMQMSWQVCAAHGVFRHIVFGNENPMLKGRSATIARHAICWGLPILLTCLVQLTYPDAYQQIRVDGDILHPWCGMRSGPDECAWRQRSSGPQSCRDSLGQFCTPIFSIISQWLSILPRRTMPHTCERMTRPEFPRALIYFCSMRRRRSECSIFLGPRSQSGSAWLLL